ncbi:MAG: gliding motility-associated C-terminal domain-containing protein [Agriterribacter sp.]
MAQGGGTYSSTTGLSINASTGAVNLGTSTAGTYTVTYNFSNGTCSTTTTASITINAQPTVSITNPAAVCSPATVDITATAVTAGSTSGLTYTYFTDAAATTALSNANAVASSGTYYIKGTTASGCYDIKPVTVTINALPTASISYAGSPYCATGTATVILTGQSGGTYSSTTGLSINATTGAVNLVSSTAGTYTVTYSFSNGTCSNTTTASITINAQPVIVITNPSAVCSPTTVDITAAAITAGSTSGLTYTYFTDAAVTTALSNPNAVAVSGTYYIKGVTASGCYDVKPVTVTINPLPSIVITNPAAVCSPATIDITAATVTAGSTSGLTYTYFTNAAATTTLASPNTVASSGTYYIKGTNSNGCSDVKPVSVVINPAPAVVITNPAAVCAPATIDLTTTAVTSGSTSGLTYTYFTDATGTTTLSNPGAVASGGTYYIKGTTASGCSDIQPVTVVIDAMPVATIAYNGGPYCPTGTATVTQTGKTGGTYTAPAGVTINASTGAINLAASLPGQYTITYTFTNGVCTNAATTIIHIGTPSVVIHDPAAVCAPGSVDITAAAITTGSDAGLTYSYYTDAAGTNLLSNPGAVAASGTYYIKGISGAGCPSLPQPVQVVINPQPVITVTADKTLVCKWEEVTLGATAPGSTVVWQQVGTGNNVTVYPSENTNYTAIATDALGCTNSDHISISVRNFKAALTATPNPVMSGTTVTLTSSANSSYTAVAWAPAQFFVNQQATAQAILITDSSKTFTTVLKSVEGCMDTASVYVVVNDNTKELFIPNAFTPNNDGKNDIFKVYGTSVKSVEISVYNQWGNLMIATSDNNKGWDGTYKGKQQPVGIYLYAIKIQLYNNGTVIRNGTISLVR